MPKFAITISERHAVTYEVVADNLARVEAMLEEEDPSSDCIIRDDIVGSDIIEIVEVSGS